MCLLTNTPITSMTGLPAWKVYYIDKRGTLRTPYQHHGVRDLLHQASVREGAERMVNPDTGDEFIGEGFIHAFRSLIYARTFRLNLRNSATYRKYPHIIIKGTLQGPGYVAKYGVEVCARGFLLEEIACEHESKGGL